MRKLAGLILTLYIIAAAAMLFYIVPAPKFEPVNYPPPRKMKLLMRIGKGQVPIYIADPKR